MNKQMLSVMQEIKKTIKGKDDVIETVLCAMLAGGHILLEDIPGVGKTTLAVSISKSMDLSYKRVQFTPDVLPSDITGFSMFHPQKQEFEYHEGAAMCNLLLADEINRTSPKTQSALLEIMEEGRVSVDGVTYNVPNPFLVIATQNPFGSAGTQRLPESQMDRFMVRLTMGYPNHESALDILRTDVSDSVVNTIINADRLIQMQEAVKAVFTDDAIYEMVVNFTEATRASEFIQLGLSPRGSKALLRMAKANAFMNERNYVIPEDVVRNVLPVVAHRIVLNSKAKAKDIKEEQVLKGILQGIRVPKMG